MTEPDTDRVETWTEGWGSDPRGVRYYARCLRCTQKYVSGDRQQSFEDALNCCADKKLIADGPGEPDSDRPTMLRQGGIQQRMKCGGSVAHNIEEAFVTVEQLVDAIEGDDPLTEADGIGPKTAEVIVDWWENREEREANASSSTVTRQSSSSLSISFHRSWEDALGIEVSDR